MTIGVLQETQSLANSGPSMSKAFTSNLTALSSIHVVVRALSASSFPSVTDDQGNVYTQRGAVLNDGGAGHFLAQFTADNASAAPCTVTVNMSPNGASASMWIREIGGTSGYDGHVEAVQAGLSSTTTDGVTSGTVTPTVQPGLISGFHNITIAAPPVLSSGTGFIPDGTPFGANSSVSQHKRYTALTPIASTATDSTTNSTNAFSFACIFKEAGATVISVLQETNNTATSGASMSQAFASNVTLGSSIHVVARALTATSFPSVTDNHGNVYTQRGPTLNDGGGGHVEAQFTADNCAAGATTVQVNMSPNGTSALMWIREIGGTAGFDIHNEQYQPGLGPGADVVSSGNSTPSLQPGLISGFTNTVVGSGLPSAGGGFVSDTNPWGTASLSEHLVYTDLSPIDAAFTAGAGSSTSYMTFAALFKQGTPPAGGSSSSNGALMLLGAGS